MVFDLLFPTSRDGDDALARTLKAHAGKVVLAASFENLDSQDRGAKAPVLVAPNSALLDAVKDDWGM